MAERMENKNAVNSVDELRTEHLLNFIHDTGLHLLIRLLFGRLRRKPERLGLDDIAGSDIGSHDDDSILEIYGSALRIGQMSFVENLQQYIENVRMGFLDLIKQNDRIRVLADLVGQLTAFFISDIAGR